MKPISWFITAVICTVAMGAAVHAQQTPKLSIEIKVEKEVKVKKDNKWVVERRDGSDAKTGEVLVYTITYTNTTKGDLKDVAIVDPIPKDTVYVPGTATGKNAEITFSIDGGNNFKKQPIKYKTKKTDGSEIEKVATPDMYTHIKWLIKRKVPPGKSGQVFFKSVVK